LQGWIARLPRDFPLVVASHDRAFLDTVTTRTLFLRAEASRAFPLPYSRARAAMDEADAADERRFRNEMQKAGQLRRQAARLKNIGINSGSDLLTVKTRQLTARAARIEAMARPAHAEHGAGAIRLAGAGAAAKALVTFDDADITAPDGRRLFGTGRKWITRGDRVVLLGANGAGKSRMMATVIAALGGEVAGLRVAPSVVAGNTDQGLAEFDGAGTPLEAVAGRFDIGDQAARSLLAGAGIGIDAQGAAMARLSGGQRARLAMLVLRLTRPNLYLLDEPTNHLDIEGQETLEAELCADEAACLLISHDRAFVQAVGTRFWQIEGRRLQEIEDAEGYFRAALEAGR
jgi:ATPase subunit of ABC transporter with duplicated ATPase domains